ncbi:MAG: helicase-related protein [Desulfosalsimonas sp.]
MLLDNRTKGKVGEWLSSSIKKKSRLSVLTSQFSIYAYEELKKQLDAIDNIRLILSDDPSGQANYGSIPLKNGLTGGDRERAWRNKLTMAHIARQCAGWIENKARIKTTSSTASQNLFHIQNNSGSAALHGSSPFTAAGLGFAPVETFEMNMGTTNPDETQGLLQWFESIWEDNDIVRDATQDVLEYLKELYSVKPPELIYFYMLYHLFKDFSGQYGDEDIIKSRTGIQDSVIWNKLYKFQRDGVLGAIDKIEKYNGCIIADSVGLGKTFEALAIIKYYELRNDRVLVLCPKKIRENWTIYTVNDKRNLLAKDRFNFDVLNHTDLTRENGYSGEINLQTVNWGNYDLVVIDESHNFRNNPSKKDGKTRYSRLMQDIIRSGVRTKVLMLSATPVNNRMNDLKNQVAFITEGEDKALADNGIASIEECLRKAQARFNEWLHLGKDERKTETLLDTLNLSYFKLLDLLTIARSRKHIEKYYDVREVGDFPKRATPVNIKADIDTQNQFPPLKEINRTIRRLNLSAYAPLRYVLPGKLPEYSRKYDMQLSGGSVFRQMDREESLIHLMRVNLFKRMESSIHSFAMSLEKLLTDVRGLIEKLEADTDALPHELSIEDIEIDDEDAEPFLIGRKIKVLVRDVDRIRWKQELQEDEALLHSLLEHARKVEPEKDKKLRHLKQTIAEKYQRPINPGNKKALVFTAFADTAEYLYTYISTWAAQEHGVYCAVVTGRTGSNKTNMPGISNDFHSILSSFSPVSKGRSQMDPDLDKEIDILIATDCISEGQNLQDCDYLVNYDIHWNPVRIIQRFGRIDRLGSTNTSIQLVNFWPNMELDEYIDLEARVSGRMVLLDISATGEENVIEYESSAQMKDLEYRRNQLEQLQNEVPDIEDLGGSISITDMTLNDFRMDLADYLKSHKNRLQNMPFGIFSAIPAQETAIEELSPGVIFCLQNRARGGKKEMLNPLEPYYIVYVYDSGEIRLNYPQAKNILDLLKKACYGRSRPGQRAVEQFEATTRKGADMGRYQEMLSRAVSAITGKSDEKGVESLFQRGGTVIGHGAGFRGIEDFEVVAYLILLPQAETAHK